MMADDFAVWLLSAIAEDAKVAREQRRFEQYVEGTGRMFSVSRAIVSMAPHRAVAECEAKRRIVETHIPQDNGPDQADWCWTCEGEVWPCRTLRLLALPYADWRGYRDEWKPE